MEQFTITELSSNNSGNTFPQQFGDNVVWQSEVDSDDEIFFYNGNETIQLTDNDVSDNSPKIFGDNVVWQGEVDGDNEIFFYDGSETIQLTDNDVPDNLPQISGNNIVWQSGSGNESEIFFYNGSETIQLTDNDVNDLFPRISGNNIVWQSGNLESETEIFFYDGSETIQLTDNDVPDNLPQISGNNIVWQSGSDNESEIFFYNGSETIQLTNNDVPDTFSLNPLTSIFLGSNIVGNNIYWISGTEDNYKVLIYNGNETLQFSENGVVNNNVIDDVIDSLNSNYLYYQNGMDDESEIFFYNGSETIQLTDNDVPEGLVSIPPLEGRSGNTIWQTVTTSESGEETVSLFLATPNNANLVSGATVYRFLNNETGVHFYTADETERDAVQELNNFSFEGASYNSVDPLTGASEATPVYRFLNQNTGVHLYTVSETERENVEELDNFSFEGEAFSAYATEVEGSIPVYRFFNSNTGAHFYTPSAEERDNVEDMSGFQSEGVAYYALPLDDSEI